MGNRAGIGMLGVSPTFDASVAPPGTSSALRTCQELSCLSKYRQQSQLGPARLCICAGLCPAFVVPWENSCSPLCFADSFQGSYFVSCAESWFMHCPPPLPVRALGELTMDYTGWGISVPHMSSKIKSNLAIPDFPSAQLLSAVCEMLWKGPRVNADFFLNKKTPPDQVVALKALIFPRNLFFSLLTKILCFSWQTSSSVQTHG